MNVYQIVSLVVTSLGIIITAIMTYVNTNKQIKNISKENNKPILFINNIELISTHNDLEEYYLYFNKYSDYKSGKLKDRIIANGPSTIKIYLSNSGQGLAKNIYIFNKKSGDRINYYVTESNDKWIKKGNILLVPNGQDNSIEVIPQYVREKELVEKEEKCSDYCDIVIYYSDINNNFYSQDIRLEIIYLKKEDRFVINYFVKDVKEFNLSKYKDKHEKTQFNEWVNKMLL